MQDTAVTAIDQDLLKALTSRGFNAVHVRSRDEARAAVLDALPDGALVAHGGSTTLTELGIVDALVNSPRIRYGNAQWMALDDRDERLAMRKTLSINADVFLGSVQAVTRSGQVIGADQSGSRQAFYVYGPAKVIWVVGRNKIVPDLAAALARLHDVVTPLEDARVRASGFAAGTAANKIVVFEAEPVPGRTTIVLAEESLGF
jgi:L-lactate utilization protein LutC